MDIKKLSVIGLTTCALLFSCNKEQEMSRDAAKEFVKTNYVLSETPTPKTAKMGWDFYDTPEESAKFDFEVFKNLYFKDKSVTYSVKGEALLSDTMAESFASTYLNEAKFDKTFENPPEVDWKFYKDGNTLHAIGEFSEGETLLKVEQRYDDKGRLTYFSNYGKDRVEQLYSNVLEYFVLTY